MGIVDRFKNAWNAFNNRDRPDVKFQDYGYSSYLRPDRPRFSRGNEKSIITSVYNRIALDCAAVKITHARLDYRGRYLKSIDSRLNDCLTLEANKDQTSRAFIQDIVISMFDDGVVAVVPVDTNIDPTLTNGYDILSLRTAKILEWYPDDVKLRLYNDRKGIKEEIMMPKSSVAIIENPFYAVMNEPNSTMQRLIRKLALLDTVDEQTAFGKLDMIIQLPYIIKTEDRRKQAEIRRKSIEDQLSSSKLGIAYTDGTEKIMQLNRPLENHLMDQIQYLTELFYSQMGITVEIMNGTADEQTMISYNSRIIEAIISAIVGEFNRKFLSVTARTQRQAIMYFTDPFKLVPISGMAQIVDIFTSGEIMSSNEIRQIIGLPPSDDPQADELRNKNLSPTAGQEFANTENQNGENPKAIVDDVDTHIEEGE